MTIHRSARLIGAILLTCCSVALLAGLLSAAPPAPQNAATKRVVVKAGTVISQRSTGDVRVTTLTDAEMTQDDAVFTANNVVIRSEKNVHEFTCTGNPVFTDTENHITADKALFYSTPRRAEFSDHVHMISTPKSKPPTPGGNTARDDFRGQPSDITCDALSYDYAGKTALARGNVVVTQKTRIITADQATYDQKAELITLKGNIHLKSSGNDELKELSNADLVTVSVANDWIDIRPKTGERAVIILDVNDDAGTPAPPANGK